MIDEQGLSYSPATLVLPVDLLQANPPFRKFQGDESPDWLCEGSYVTYFASAVLRSSVERI